MSARALSNRRLAYEAGIGRKHLQLIRGGKVSPTETTLEKIASGATKILGESITVADIVLARHAATRRKVS
jgi:predicted transcriptional regulator